jgi:hypothetical protein
MTDAVTSARSVARSPVMSGTARFGLAARAFIYLVIGWLAFQIALGHRTQQANQKGALAEVGQHAYGLVLLWVLALGFAAYSLWRLSEATFGTAAEGPNAGPRVQALVRGVVYGALSVTTFSFIAGRSRRGQAQQQETTTTILMKHGYGQSLVVVAGLIVFAIAGALAMDAAVTYDPAKSSGLDGALRTLANRAYGSWLLGIVAIGLITFGIYGFGAARWAKT